MKRIKRMKRFNGVVSSILSTIILAFVFFCSLGNVTIVNAAETNGELPMGWVYIESLYSDGITPQEGDVFIINYYYEEGNVYGEMTIDASYLVDNKGKLELICGNYNINSIEYRGTNSALLEDGNYSITSRFFVANEEKYEETIKLCVGYEKAKNFFDTYSIVLWVNYETDFYGNPLINAGLSPEEQEQIIEDRKNANYGDGEANDVSTESTTEATTEITESTEFDENYGVEIQEPTNGDAPDIEYYDVEDDDTNKESASSSVGGKLLILAIIAVIVGVIVYILHKKKII